MDTSTTTPGPPEGTAGPQGRKPGPARTKVQANFRLRPTTVEAIKGLAWDLRKTQAEIIEEAIKDYKRKLVIMAERGK